MKVSTAREYRRHVENIFVNWAPLPGIESGQLARDDMVAIVACLRHWEHDGTWGQAYVGYRCLKCQTRQ